MNSPIILIESDQRYVTLTLDQTVPEQYITYSTTVTIDFNNSLHNQLIGLINASNQTGDPNPVFVDPTKDKYISIVFLDVVTDESQTFLSKEIRGLFSTPHTGTGFGIVMVFDNNGHLELKYKPKRTTGKVSNTLG